MSRRIGFRLRLGRGDHPITGRCHLVAAVPVQGSVRLAVAFEEIQDEARLRIEDFVVDTICGEIRTMLLRKAQPAELSPSPADNLAGMDEG